MLKEFFIGRNPSHFSINALVKAFILSEALLWSAFNFIFPIFAIFAANNIKGGNIEIAASAYSIYLIVRVLVELFSGKYFARVSDSKKLKGTVLGIVIMSFGYLGFAYTQDILALFTFYALIGVGIGIASPPKNTLFSTHLDKQKETAEWGMYDGITFIGMALAGALGGFIAKEYGFKFLFLLSAVVNLVSILPYLTYLRKDKRTKA